LGLSAGTYQIRVRESGNICIASSSDVVLSDPGAPIITNVWSMDPSYCGLSDGIIMITATGTSMEYSIDGGNTWQASNIFTGLSGGTYPISVRNSNGTCQVNHTDIIITDKVTPSINSVSVVNPTGMSSTDGSITISATGTSIEYSIDGGITWQNSKKFTNLSVGTYQVSVRNRDETCVVSNGSTTLVAQGSRTVISPPITTTVHLFPNPATQVINVNVDFDTEQNIDIQLINNAGQMVLTQKKSNIAQYLFTFDISYLAAGLYTVRIIGNEEMIIKKLVILK
jgi:hypothetical protein